MKIDMITLSKEALKKIAGGLAKQTIICCCTCLGPKSVAGRAVGTVVKER